MENETREFGMNQQKLQDYIRENVKSNNDTVRFFFSGYLKAMEEAAQIAKVELHMTYAFYYSKHASNIPTEEMNNE